MIPVSSSNNEFRCSILGIVVVLTGYSNPIDLSQECLTMLTTWLTKHVLQDLYKVVGGCGGGGGGGGRTSPDPNT